ncbi:MAG: Lipoprotein-releasing system ATP-binding protein LolD [Chlamydiae bacterium]|nr:Lipoprotein-releasing system ATP-binding protein LolD [Chlamydiota bacterium]
MKKEALIEVESLSKTFGGRVPVPVLKNITFELGQGETVAIMGKSGEGKTTLLHILGTLDSPSSGTLRYLGKTPTKKELSSLRSQFLGLIFQAYHLIEEETALKNVLLPLEVARRSIDKAKALALLDEVGLSHRASTPAKFLSGGEKQRLGIARALCNDPQVILADEPTGNLDAASSLEVQNLLLNCSKKFNKSLLVVTHDEEFARMCDRILLLKEGELHEYTEEK